MNRRTLRLACVTPKRSLHMNISDFHISAKTVRFNFIEFINVPESDSDKTRLLGGLCFLR